LETLIRWASPDEVARIASQLACRNSAASLEKLLSLAGIERRKLILINSLESAAFVGHADLVENVAMALALDLQSPRSTLPSSLCDALESACVNHHQSVVRILLRVFPNIPRDKRVKAAKLCEARNYFELSRVILASPEQEQLVTAMLAAQSSSITKDLSIPNAEFDESIRPLALARHASSNGQGLFLIIKSYFFLKRL